MFQIMVFKVRNNFRLCGVLAMPRTRWREDNSILRKLKEPVDTGSRIGRHNGKSIVMDPDKSPTIGCNILLPFYRQ
jgi:hypothetical protein